MKLSRALKKVSRLQGEINELKGRLASCVSALEENEFESDFKLLSKQISDKQKGLIDLRAQIMATNVKHNMFRHILQLSQLKQDIDLLRKLNIKTGIELSMGYGESTKNKYKSQVQPSQRTEMVAKLQEEIETLTDALDDFNATTDII